MARAIDIVRRVAPRARPSYLAAFQAGDPLLAAAGITTPQRLAHFLAQVLHETGGLTVERESGAYSAARLVEIFGPGRHSARVTPDEARALARNGPAIFERVYGLGNPRKARELGNTQAGDGWRYRGGGLMQTTGRANYRRMGERCGVDFEGRPELVLAAEHALKPALAEWVEGGLNRLADRDDLLTITRRINGGTNGLADRRAWYARVRPLIDRVDLVDGPVPPPPATLSRPAKTLGATVAGTLVAAPAATAAGNAGWVSPAAAVVLVVAAVVALAGAAAWFWLHRRPAPALLPAAERRADSGSAVDQLTALRLDAVAGLPAADTSSPSDA